MSFRRKGSRISKFGTTQRLKIKKKLAQETMEKRERRLELCRIRSKLKNEKRAKMEVEMLHRLETILQAEVVDNQDNDSDDSRSDEDEPVRMNVPGLEILKTEFPSFSEVTEDKIIIDDDDRTRVSKVYPIEVTGTDQKVDLKESDQSNTVLSDHVLEIDEQPVVVKDEIIDETYEKYKSIDYNLKEEDNASCETSQLSTGLDVFGNSLENRTVFNPVIMDSECDDFKNVVLLEESNCDVEFYNEDCTPDEDCIESSCICEPDNVSVNQTEVEVERIHECDLCKSRYQSKTRLRIHSLIHKVYPELKFSFKCRVCERRFTRKLGLKKHMLTHSSIPEPLSKTFECDVCGKMFSRKKSLDHHLLWHLSDPSLDYLYKCKTCGEKFMRECNFKMHAFIHKTNFVSVGSKKDSSVYWFQCDVCKKKFMDKSGMRRHISNYHVNALAYMFECEMESQVDAEPLLSVKEINSQTSEPT